MKNVRLLISSLVIVFGAVVNSYGQGAPMITHYAGGGGSLGDGGTATAAQLNNNYMIAVDATGNLFIADQNNSRIRRIDATTRIITTIAGDGTAGYVADGIPATAARVNVPVGLTIDAANNLYIGDRGNHRIRKIDGSTGLISTLCGTGTAGTSPDGTMASLTQVNNPRGVAVDLAGNVYFTDGNVGGGSTHRLRKITVSSGLISTIAGTGTAGFSGDGGAAATAQLNNPRGLTVDAAGNIYVADMSSHRIRRIDFVTGIITTIAGSGSTTMGGFSGDGGAATLARLSGPTDVKVDAAGNIYIADVGNARIRQINTSGIINTIAGSINSGTLAGDWGPANGASVRMSSVVSVALMSNPNYYFISDQGQERIRQVRPNSIPYFTGPSTQSFNACEDGPAINISSMLAIYDSDRVQIETWSVGAWAPMHGSLNLTGTGTANSGVITPTGKTYTPTPGYSGMDSFIVQISDGMNSSTDTFYVTIDPLPVMPPLSGFDNVCEGGTVTLTHDSTGGVWSASNANATVAGGVVTGVTAGTVSISYTMTNACGPRSAIQAMTVNPLPNAGTITGTPFVCVGSTTLLADAAPGGSWSASNSNATVSAGLVTGVTVGTVDISYTVVNTCGTDNAIVTVTVDAIPSVPAIVGSNNVCVAATTTLTNTTSGGTWSASNANATVTSGGVVSGVTAGTLDISYTVTNGCGTTAVGHAMTVNPLPDAGTITGAPNVCIAGTTALTDLAPGGTWSASNSNATVSSGGVVTGVSVGAVVISYSVTNVCGTAVATYNVNVISSPTAGVITGPSNVCPSTSIALSNSVGGGIWSASNGNATISGGGVVTGVTPGLDTISYTVVVSCGTATATYVITVDPLADPGTISGAPYVCVGAVTTVTDPVVGGVWSSSSPSVATVSSGGTVTGVAAGTTIITYSVTNVCGTMNAIKSMTVNANVTPAVTFTAAPGFTTCPSTLVTYTPIPVNGGSTPSYEWRVNGFVLGVSSTFNHTPIHGDVISTTMTSSAVCPLPATATYSVTVTVNPTLVPAVNISSGVYTDTVCVGTAVTYTATPVNGGTTPSYQWYVNSTPMGTGNPFVYVPADNDIITAALTSSYPCPSPATVMSSDIEMTVDITQTPAVTITASPGSPICVGTAVTYTSHPLYGGIAPFFSWTKNGIAVATGPTYTAIPANGDVVRCMLASSSTCRTADSVYSNNIGMVAQNPVSVTVTIAQSATVIGVGGSATFTATVVTAALMPTYRWYENGVLIPGEIGPTYTAIGTTLGTKTINCVAGSGDACATTGTSNILTLAIVPVGVNDVTTGSGDLKLLPNPNKGIFTMNMQSGIDEPVQVVITNILGQKVKEFTTTTNKETEVTLGQAPGLYFLAASTANGKYVAKVIVE